MEKKIEVVLCYAHKDEDLVQGLQKHLNALQRQGLVDIWNDRRIAPGTEREHEIDKHLKSAHIILLLVSPDFIDSDYCYSVEMMHAMERHDAGEARVIPIILRPTMWQRTPFGKLQALPIDATPVTDRLWYSQDEAFYNIAKGIGSVIEDFIARQETIRQQEKLFALHHEEQIVDALEQTSQDAVSFPGLDKAEEPHQENTSTNSSLPLSSSNQISFPVQEIREENQTTLSLLAPSSIFCSHCQTENSAHARYCRHCGKSLSTSQISADRTFTYTLEEEVASLPVPHFTLEEICAALQQLQDQAGDIAKYFPAAGASKEKRLAAWKQQIDRAQRYVRLLDAPLLQDLEMEQTAHLLRSFTEAVRALNFTRGYTIKLVGPTGVGKSTLLTALLGRDILPTGFGSAITGARTRILTCSEQEPEELHVHFLTRQAFDQLLAQTEVNKNKELAQNKDGPYAREWKRLVYLKESSPDEEDGETYIEKYLGKRLVIPPTEWKALGYKFIVEPVDENIPCLVRLVDFVQFKLHVGQLSLLPLGSIMVDLPGGSAGKVSHEAILQEELQQLDAVILVAGGSRYDNESTRQIFEQVRDAIWNNNRPSTVAERMTFVAVTRWDEVKTRDDLIRARGGMDTLLEVLPSSYQRYRKVWEYPFYPIRAFDARMAMLGLEGATLDTDQQEEARIYMGHIIAVYNQLREIDPQLPAAFTAREFRGFPHQAMLNLSGLPDLAADLQQFLAEQRFEVQLQYIIQQLDRISQQLEDLCWKRLYLHSFSGRNLQSLKQQISKRTASVQLNRTMRLQQTCDKMRLTWRQALDNYTSTYRQPPNQNKFYLALSNAHNQAVNYLKQCIDSKDFDSFIEIPTYSDDGRTKASWTIVPDNDTVEVHGNELRSELRSRLAEILDQLMQGHPAEELADMFLSPIRKQGKGTGGALNIKGMAFDETSTELDEIEQSFDELLLGLRDTASQICRFIAVNDLFDERHMLTKQHVLIRDFYALKDILVATESGEQQGTSSTPEDILELGHAIMKKMVDILSGNLADHIYRPITLMYYKELEKQMGHTTYKIASTDPQAFSREPGHFHQITERWFHAMLDLLSTSQTLGAVIDHQLALSSEPTIDFKAWAELIEEIRREREKGMS